MKKNNLNCFIHNKAICETKNIGKNTKIWAFSYILSKATIGSECNICSHVFIENDVIIGDKVTIKSGVQLWDGTRVQNGVFIGPNVTFANDLFPRSKVYPKKFLKTFIFDNASIGANSTILPGLTIGKNSFIGAGSVVTKSVADNVIVMGNPARVTGYVDTFKKGTKNVNFNNDIRVFKTKIKGVLLYKLQTVNDKRGAISVLDFAKSTPFIPKRFFVVYNVPKSNIRGEHAHKKCHQFLTVLKGSAAIITDDGNKKQEFLLNDINREGIYLPPMTWGVQYKHSDDCIMAVFASHSYNDRDYIRDYNDYIKLKKI